MHSLTRIAALIRREELSSPEVVNDCLARVTPLDPVYHAHVSVPADEARAAAGQGKRIANARASNSSSWRV